MDEWQQNEWDDQLHREMRRVEAPGGLADAVLARVRVQEKVQSIARVRRPGMKTAGWPSLLLLAASLVVAAGSALEVHHEQQVRQAQQIAGEFNQAMALTSRTLHHVDRNVVRAGTLADRHPEI